ncbi:C2D1B protein, partial [Amia calva]|nr:C2D1B protein [Amia calva]
MYKTAIANAKTAGESTKARRYERGLKTLETMLTSVKKGKNINEAEIPPAVATGKPAGPGGALDQQSTPGNSPEVSVTAEGEESVSSPGSATTPEMPAQISPTVEKGCSTDRRQDGTTDANREATKALLLGRQREYKIAAVKAKQDGDLDKAKQFLKINKTFDAVIEALENGKPIDLSNLPPPPGAVEIKNAKPSPSRTTGGAVEENVPLQAADSMPTSAGPPQPKDVLEALEQRMAKYKEACAQAKSSGDDRKARMHDRIAKQYQSAIRTHKAGRPVNFDELPIPPGFPPIPGQEGAGPEQGIAAVLETASRLATDTGKELEDDDAGEEDEHQENKPPKKPMLAVPPTVASTSKGPSPGQPRRIAPSPSTESHALSPTAQQQLDFLEGRRKQYMKAALQAKQKNDMEQARIFLRTAKGFEPMIEAAKSGQAVDISKVPSPPGDEDGDFILVHHSDVQISEKAEDVYTPLLKILKEQYNKCMTYSKQFTHLGNITETTKFEKMAESCKKNMEILKLAQTQGLDPPKYHFEERTYKTLRIFPELSSTEMVVVIVKGINLPAPHGIATNDLDAYVKFEFPYPSTEQAQKHKTAVIKNTNCPEYNQSFTLSINKNHRAFRRVIQSKGLKLEVFHKGGFLRSDKPVGSALLKLEKLETESEVREIIEVIDGRKPTGGRLEVKVRLREPLSGQDVQSTTERWLVLEQPKVGV